MYPYKAQADWTMFVWDADTTPNPELYTPSRFRDVIGIEERINKLKEYKPLTDNPKLTAVIDNVRQQYQDDGNGFWQQTHFDELEASLKDNEYTNLQLVVPSSSNIDAFISALSTITVSLGLHLFVYRPSVYDEKGFGISDLQQIYCCPDGGIYCSHKEYNQGIRLQFSHKADSYIADLRQRGIAFPEQAPKRRTPFAKILTSMVTPLIQKVGLEYSDTIKIEPDVTKIQFTNKGYGTKHGIFDFVNLNVVIFNNLPPFKMYARAEFYFHEHIKHMNIAFPDYKYKINNLVGWLLINGFEDIENTHDIARFMWALEDMLTKFQATKTLNDLIDIELTKFADGKLVYDDLNSPEKMMLYRLSGRPDYKELAQRSVEALKIKKEKHKAHAESITSMLFIFDELMAYLDTMTPLEQPKPHQTSVLPTSKVD